jgi:hypothetical protein
MMFLEKWVRRGRQRDFLHTSLERALEFRKATYR